MTITVAPPLTAVLLSHEELGLLLRLIQADDLPGATDDPLIATTGEQVAVGMLVAERSLRARELARIGPGGRLLVQSTVLAGVAVCGHAEESLFVTKLAPGVPPARWAGYLRGDAAVAHTRPEEALHMLALLEDRATLADHAIAACGTEIHPAAGVSSALPEEVLIVARSEAAAGNFATAAAHLEPHIGSEQAQVIAEVLAGPHDLVLLYHVKHRSGADPALREATLLRVPTGTWLLQRDSLAAAPAECTLAPVSATQMRELIGHWISA